VMCSGGPASRPSPKSPLLVKDIGCLPALKGFLSPCMYSYFFFCFFLSFQNGLGGGLLTSTSHTSLYTCVCTVVHL
jgi:hypothetical protein